MTWWNREILPRREVQVEGTPVQLVSDGDAWGDAQQADSLRAFVDVEYLDADCKVEIYRLAGASSDSMQVLDTLPFGGSVTNAEVRKVEWPKPLAAFVGLSLTITRTAMSGTKVAVIRVLHTARVGG